MSQITREVILRVFENFPGVEFPDDDFSLLLTFPDGSTREVPMTQHPSPATEGAEVTSLIISEEVLQFVLNALGDPDALDRLKAQLRDDPDKDRPRSPAGSLS